MPKKCANDALKLLSKSHSNIRGSKIAVLGLGFRGEVEDSRLSPTYAVVKEFLKKGCKVVVHDPYILEDKNLPSKVVLTKNLNQAIKKASLIFISSDHKMYSKLNTKSFANAKKPLLIFDGRNVLNKKNLKKASILTVGANLNQNRN